MPVHAYDIHIGRPDEALPRIVWIEATSRDAALVRLELRGEYRPQDGERIKRILCEQEQKQKDR